MALQNAATSFYDTTIVAARDAETPDADWVEGMNRGGSCAPGIGVHTGFVPISDTQWTLPAVNTVVASSYIGLDSGVNDALVALDKGDDTWKNVGFILTEAVVAVDGILGTISANDYINHTGEEVPDATWCFGIKST